MLTSDQVLYDVLRYAPDAIAVFDSRELRIAFANESMLQIWNKKDDIIGKSFVDAFSDSKTQSFIEILQKVWDSSESSALELVAFPIVDAGQLQTRHFNFEFKALPDKNGQTYSIIQSVKAAFPEKNVSKAPLFSGEIDELIVQAELAKRSQIGLFDLDIKQNVLLWDQRCRDLFFVSAAKKGGSPLDFLNGVYQADKLRVIKAMSEAYEEQTKQGEFNVTFRTGTDSQGLLKRVHALGMVYFDEKHNPVRLVGSVRDISDTTSAMDALRKRDVEFQQVNKELGSLNEELMALNKELEASNLNLIQAEEVSRSLNNELQFAFDKLKLNEDRMNLAIQSAELGTWTLDIAEGNVFFDDRTKEMFGYLPGNSIAYDKVLRYIHDDDRTFVDQAVQMAINPKSDGLYEVQFRTVGATDGRLRWLHCKGRAYFDELNQPMLFSGTARDITDVTLAQEKIDHFNNLIAEKEKIQQLIVDSAQIGTFTFNLNTKEIQLNAHARAMFAFDAEEEIITNEILEAYMLVAESAMHDAYLHKKPCDYSYQLIDKRSGKTKWLRSFGSGTADNDGLGHTFYGVIIDITAQKEEEQRKIDFLSIASHELRSPLTSLSGYLQILMLKRNQMDDERVHSMVVSATRQAERMRLLIDSFLDIARVNEGKLQLRRNTFDANGLFSDIKKTLSETVSSHIFIFEDYTDKLSLYADRDKLEQVIINFVNNAIKYAPSKTSIHIHAEQMGANLITRVIDHGSGISITEQAKIFDRFYRVENTQNIHVNGFGIGLFISKEIIRLHDGEIGLISEEGNGTTFWFSIPIINAENLQPE
ncbi:ATP-binding protein [Sphingobacterium deserti]|uniref:histidine kinase n=1 Tax=Sphingobacterium deserti TaxID=1229276 RepID=A0A0B8T6J0_9SPHI|nr:ATP-binding protein [Sphingobacterium deserti]KGE12880.1 PAS sensor protein [Sphingobacterium deserti]